MLWFVGGVQGKLEVTCLRGLRSPNVPHGVIEKIRHRISSFVKLLFLYPPPHPYATVCPFFLCVPLLPMSPNTKNLHGAAEKLLKKTCAKSVNN